MNELMWIPVNIACVREPKIPETPHLKHNYFESRCKLVESCKFMIIFSVIIYVKKKKILKRVKRTINK